MLFRSRPGFFMEREFNERRVWRKNACNSPTMIETGECFPLYYLLPHWTGEWRNGRKWENRKSWFSRFLSIIMSPWDSFAPCVFFGLFESGNSFAKSDNKKGTEEVFLFFSLRFLKTAELNRDEIDPAVFYGFSSFLSINVFLFLHISQPLFLPTRGFFSFVCISFCFIAFRSLFQMSWGCFFSRFAFVWL